MELPEGWIHWGDVNGGEFMHLGSLSVTEIPSNPDITMHVAVTHRELALLVFALVFPGRMFPELADDVASLIEKLQELSAAQEFLPLSPESDSPGGGE